MMMKRLQLARQHRWDAAALGSPTACSRNGSLACLRHTAPTPLTAGRFLVLDMHAPFPRALSVLLLQVEEDGNREGKEGSGGEEEGQEAELEEGGDGASSSDGEDGSGSSDSDDSEEEGSDVEAAAEAAAARRERQQKKKEAAAGTGKLNAAGRPLRAAAMRRKQPAPMPADDGMAAKRQRMLAAAEKQHL